ncbi:MAG: methylmalonyl Co-A mutase-associated GTPase MeaB [Bacteroidales bacterium]|jgi:LAO/AO transport system kinase|nr:methylmalonyl Co-A mutase-associated GTPase MeaB [Bacteroidales bacterium]
MEKRNSNNLQSTLKVHEGINQPPGINPKLIRKSTIRKKKEYPIEQFVEKIISGDMAMLSQAITLVESLLPQHYEKAQEIIERCLPYASNSIRIGITGAPGAGKSSLIETLGLQMLNENRKLAALAIDPSSAQTKGSILGDKTRMELLSVHPRAFIRPSPSAGELGGVARKTRETIILCEAAGFDTIIVETVGVGQSEIEVGSMVDIFVLLMLAGSGDELQGIKRGIMEMADIIAISKADGENRITAETAKVSFQNALNLFPLGASGWKPKALTCSALDNAGITELWKTIREHLDFVKISGYFETFRKHQTALRMDNEINEFLRNAFYNDEKTVNMLPALKIKLQNGEITSYKAAKMLTDAYFNSERQFMQSTHR